MKLLVIPSWYPSLTDKVNGSFFREHARLVSEVFDVKVLHIRFSVRPSLNVFKKNPIQLIHEWVDFVLAHHNSDTKHKSDSLYLDPPLIEGKRRIFGLTKKQKHKERVSSYIKEIQKLLESGWTPDLIRAHSAYPAGLVAKHIKQLYGIPYVISEHMPFSLSGFDAEIRSDVKSAFDQADLVLSLSYDKVRQLCMSGIDIEPNLIFNYVDDAFFNETAAPYRPGEPLRIISVGAASHYKDHRTLIRALSTLKNRNIPFTMELIGLRVWGNMYEETVQLIKSYDLQNDITVIDILPREELRKHLSASNVFLMTSIQEGFPNAVLEALSCGLFVVATRHGGTEDILNSSMGRIVEIKNHGKISDLLENIFLGEIKFTPHDIRNSVKSICGRDVFKERLVSYYKSAIHT